MFTDLVLFDVRKTPFDNIKYLKVNLSTLKSVKDSIVIVEGNQINRDILENTKVNVLLSPHKDLNKDSLHFRNSGLNQVLCNLARKNNISIGFSFSEFLNSNERHIILGKMQQNVRLCRKFKVPMLIATFANNDYELRSLDTLKAFAYILGMNPEETKKSLARSSELAKDKVYK